MLEKEIMKHVENALSCLQMTGEVVFYLRVNSGSIRTSTGSWVRLADKGTPDWIVIVRGRDGRLILLFIECKSDTGKLRPEQEAFKFKYEKIEDVYFLELRDISILKAFINDIAIDLVDKLPTDLRNL